MRTKQAITKKLNIPAEKAWQAIRDIGRLDVWFPIIATCQVEGKSAGAHRYMTLEEGGKITDLIEEISDSNKRFVYLRTESPFPVTHYRGTVEVFASYDGLAVVAWTIDFDSAPGRQCSRGGFGQERHLRRDRRHGEGSPITLTLEKNLRVRKTGQKWRRRVCAISHFRPLIGLTVTR